MFCFNVYQPGGNSVLTSPLCTFGGTITVTADLAPPPQNGTYVVMVYAAGNAGVADYNLEVSCLGTPGTCPSTPKCVLEDALSYASGTLTMNLTIGTPYAATWNGWLVSENTPTLLWSVSQPITEPTANRDQDPSRGRVRHRRSSFDAHHADTRNRMFQLEPDQYGDAVM
jgi:hypothetical protein